MNLQVDKSLEFSRLSNAIKVPMIILVIFVHENLNLERDGYLGLLLAAMANVSVPVFFLISGYYFFKGEELGKDVYLSKLKKRIRTLLLPYLLWNLLPMLNIVAGNFYSIIFRGKSTEDLQSYFFDLWDKGVYSVWWNITSGTMPYDSPLWYMRDLMVMCVGSPVLYFIIRKIGRWGIVVLVLLYVLGVNTSITGLSMSAITFFTIGGYFSLNASRVLSPDVWAKKNKFIVLPLSLLSISIYVIGGGKSSWNVFQMLYILSGVFSFYYLLGRLPKRMIERMSGMASSVFFIYALHNTCVLAWCSGLVYQFPLPHEMKIIVIPFLTFVVCHFLYLIMKKFCPSILAVLCGGRA